MDTHPAPFSAARNSFQGFDVRKADGRRGLGHADLAHDFLKHFPIGSQLLNEQFDAWAEACGLYVVPLDAAKDSDAWMAMLQRRHAWRVKLNKAATHPRRTQETGGAYVVEHVKGETLEVRRPYEAIAETKLARQVASLVGTKKRQLEHLIQSQDWTALEGWEQEFARVLHVDIKLYKAMIDLQSEALEQKFKSLQERLRLAVQKGEIVPSNSGILAITEGILPVVEAHDADDEEDPPTC